VPVTVIADPADCTFQLDLTGGARQFSTSCDIAKGSLTNAGVAYETQAGPAGSLARIRVGDVEIESVSAEGQTNSEIRATRTEFESRLRPMLDAAGYPARAPGAMQGWSWSEVARVFSEKIGVFLILALFVVAATALYGPQAAALVELFRRAFATLLYRCRITSASAGSADFSRLSSSRSTRRQAQSTRGSGFP